MSQLSATCENLIIPEKTQNRLWGTVAHTARNSLVPQQPISVFYGPDTVLALASGSLTTAQRMMPVLGHGSLDQQIHESDQDMGV